MSTIKRKPLYVGVPAAMANHQDANRLIHERIEAEVRKVHKGKFESFEATPVHSEVPQAIIQYEVTVR